MQTIPFYVAAGSTLGADRDYANAQNAAAPVLTRGVATCLKMRLFATAVKAPTLTLLRNCRASRHGNS